MTLVLGKIPRVGVTHCEIRVSGKEQKGGSNGAGHSFLDSRTPSLFYFCSFGIMAFSGKYELESQENYEEFLEAVGMRILFFFF